MVLFTIKNATEEYWRACHVTFNAALNRTFNVEMSVFKRTFHRNVAYNQEAMTLSHASFYKRNSLYTKKVLADIFKSQKMLRYTWKVVKMA